MSAQRADRQRSKGTFGARLHQARAAEAAELVVGMRHRRRRHHHRRHLRHHHHRRTVGVGVKWQPRRVALEVIEG